MHENLFDKLKHMPLKVSIIGSGNWASAISRVVGTNCMNNSIFENTVKIWTRTEVIDGINIINAINQKHENVKYLKGIILPHNVVAYSDIVQVINDADLLIFVIPCQYLISVLEQILQNKSINLKKNVKAISLTKGLIFKDNILSLCSKVISEYLNIPCCALSGANIAIDVAREKFSESTIGGNNKNDLLIWKRVFDLPYFKINCVNESVGVEICGALKNIITMAAGFCDGINASNNSKSAIIKIGVNEIKLFAHTFYKNFDENIFFESCGFADIITSILGGRNAKCSSEFIKCKQKKSWEQLESEMLKGQKLQGTITLKYVYHIIQKNDMIKKFPLFNILYKISFEDEEPDNLLKIFMHNEIPSLF